MFFVKILIKNKSFIIFQKYILLLKNKIVSFAKKIFLKKIGFVTHF